MHQNTTETPSEQVNLQIAGQQLHIIDRAARASGKTRVEFILDAAGREAEHALLDQTEFVLDAEAFDTLKDALDSPAEPPEGLRELLSRKPAWDR